MVYRRKKNVRFRKTTRRVVRKNAIRNIARMGKLLNSRFQVYNFTRKCEYDQVYPTFGNAVDRVFTFALADLPNYTEFTTLFDQYRINAVKLTFIPRLSSADSNPLATVSAIPLS